MSESRSLKETFLLHKCPTERVGSVLTPSTGKELSFIIDAVFKKVPSPPSEKIMSLSTKSSGTN